jgi:hypothetical protein
VKFPTLLPTALQAHIDHIKRVRVCSMSHPERQWSPLCLIETHIHLLINHFSSSGVYCVEQNRPSLHFIVLGQCASFLWCHMSPRRLETSSPVRGGSIHPRKSSTKLRDRHTVAAAAASTRLITQQTCQRRRRGRKATPRTPEVIGQPSDLARPLTNQSFSSLIARAPEYS